MTNKEILKKLKIKLYELNLDPTPKKTKLGIKAKCPFHDDHTPSFNIFENENGYLIYNCFACGEKGSLKDLLKKLNINPKEYGLNEKRKFPKPFYEFMRKRLKASDKEIEYLAFNFGIEGDNEKLKIPYRDEEGNFLGGYFTRSYNKKEMRFAKGLERPLFFADDIKRFEDIRDISVFGVFITEGHMDALSLLKYNLPAVATGGSGNIEKYLATLEKLGVTNLYLAFDNDKAGREHTLNYIKKAYTKFYFNVKVIEIPEDYKDINEWLMKSDNFYNEFLEAKASADTPEGNGFFNYVDLSYGEMLKNNNFKNKYEILNKVIAFYGKILPQNYAFIDDEVINKILSYLSVDKTDWIERFEKVEIIKKEQQKKDYLINLTNDLIKSINDGDDIKVILDEYYRNASEVYLVENNDGSVYDMIDDIIKDIENDKQPYTSEFLKKDNNYLYIYPSDLNIIAGERGNGKTTFALNLLLEMLEKGYKCLYVTYEIPIRFLIRQLVGIKENIPFENTKDNMDKIREFALTYGKNFHLKEGIPIEDILFLGRYHKYDFIFVDYDEKVKTTKNFYGNYERELAYISGSLKDLARETESVVFLLSQVTVKKEKSKNGDLEYATRYSKNKEQDASLFLVVKKTENMEIRVAKNRYGFIPKEPIKLNINWESKKITPTIYI
ncbi:DnaB-like helicase C-terminal domain-containing protein [Marinitoga sp. 38H-ov]|jgi:hypothetical protein|uniref:DnaB-like helicase C-terminal domain-containing protein n=1 Tax=Marinitoga sp. 38H-ov TaxID=1755814 RepID=UPI0013ECF64B|nr:DnaB-like helicase C-terminal domain-containing protein [Marinitoga sp. 38H-ov]KAF2955836.1 hypothetical protein AS160_08770 [Marinitoga sp. 38H-ov]